LARDNTQRKIKRLLQRYKDLISYNKTYSAVHIVRSCPCASVHRPECKNHGTIDIAQNAAASDVERDARAVLHHVASDKKIIFLAFKTHMVGAMRQRYDAQSFRQTPSSQATFREAKK
jgi:hypothetical protein